MTNINIQIISDTVCPVPYHPTIIPPSTSQPN